MKLCATLLVLLTFAAISTRADDKPGAQPAAGSRGVNLADRADIGLAALNLHSTFGCIGLVAEGWQAKLYDADKVARIMQDVGRSSNLAVRLLKKLLQDEPGLAESTPISEMIDCYASLDRQAQLLTEAAKSTNGRVQQAYRQAREESWQKIAAVLGIEP
jgi:hypothetical protein